MYIVHWNKVNHQIDNRRILKNRIRGRNRLHPVVGFTTQQYNETKISSPLMGKVSLIRGFITFCAPIGILARWNTSNFFSYAIQICIPNSWHFCNPPRLDIVELYISGTRIWIWLGSLILVNIVCRTMSQHINHNFIIRSRGYKAVFSGPRGWSKQSVRTSGRGGVGVAATTHCINFCI